MKILFLDDMQIRHDNFQEWCDDFNLTEVYHVRTADEAVKAMIEHDFDVVFLDHDLAEEHYQDGTKAVTQANSGTAVAAWMVQNEARPVVVIHSYNPVGATNMFNLFRDDGFACYKIPFGPGLAEFLRKISQVKE